MSRLQEGVFAAFTIGGLIVAAWLTVLSIQKASEGQETVCEEATVLLSKERDLLSCEGGKIGHENTPQGILLTCTCPEKP